MHFSYGDFHWDTSDIEFGMESNWWSRNTASHSSITDQSSQTIIVFFSNFIQSGLIYSAVHKYRITLQFSFLFNFVSFPYHFFCSNVSLNIVFDMLFQNLSRKHSNITCLLRKKNFKKKMCFCLFTNIESLTLFVQFFHQWEDFFRANCSIRVVWYVIDLFWKF